MIVTLRRVIHELQLAESRPDVGSSKNITGGLFTWISNIYGQQIYQIYHQRASSEGYSPEHTNQDQKDYQNFNDGENYNESAQHKKISGTISGLRKCCHFYSGSVISCNDPASLQNHYQSIFFEARTFFNGVFLGSLSIGLIVVVVWASILFPFRAFWDARFLF